MIGGNVAMYMRHGVPIKWHIHLHKHVYPNIHMLHVHVKIALSNINSSVEIMPAVDQTKQTEKRPYSTESPILHYKNIDVHFPACKCL